MRARGAKITDVAVIVVAADDEAMLQTIEAIDHARALSSSSWWPSTRSTRRTRTRTACGGACSARSSSDWGGSHEFVDVSAVEGTGLDALPETVLLVADADAEPKANPKPEGSGTVIESRLDPGRGPVATLLIQRGTPTSGT